MIWTPSLPISFSYGYVTVLFRYCCFMSPAAPGVRQSLMRHYLSAAALPCGVMTALLLANRAARVADLFAWR